MQTFLELLSITHNTLPWTSPPSSWFGSARPSAMPGTAHTPTEEKYVARASFGGFVPRGHTEARIRVYWEIDREHTRILCAGELSSCRRI